MNTQINYVLMITHAQISEPSCSFGVRWASVPQLYLVYPSSTKKRVDKSRLDRRLLSLEMETLNLQEVAFCIAGLPFDVLGEGMVAPQAFGIFR